MCRIQLWVYDYSSSPSSSSSHYTAGRISAEEMVDKCKNPQDLTERVHKLGRSVGRMELDEEEGEDE